MKLPGTLEEAFSCVALSAVPYVMSAGAAHVIGGVALSTLMLTLTVAAATFPASVGEYDRVQQVLDHLQLPYRTVPCQVVEGLPLRADQVLKLHPVRHRKLLARGHQGTNPGLRFRSPDRGCST